MSAVGVLAVLGHAQDRGFDYGCWALDCVAA
jgi:hypothetical protein